MTESVLPGGGDDRPTPASAASAQAPDSYVEQRPTGPGRRADRSGGSRRGRKRRSGCLPVLLIGVLLVGVLAWFARGAVSDIRDALAGPDDYPGPGTGSVSVTIDPGQSIASMGEELESLDVVASADAFVDAARDNADSSRIQAATYEMRTQMAAADAVDLLADPANAGSGRTVTVPEGARVGQVVAAIEKATGFPEDQITALLEKPQSIGLPAEAEGNPEGYLFPATYQITDATTPESLLRQMVEQTEKAEADLDIAAKAKRLGLTPHEIITVASILEYEANRGEDYPKVARVLYNRLDDGMALQLDSTVSYVSKRKGDVWTTAAERDSESRYNTYRYTGLPPGPIGSPGKETIEAALNPAKGPWLYFVPDFEKGTTLFTDDYQQHLRNAEKAKAFCRKSDAC